MLTTESYLRDLEKEYQKSTLRDERFELTKALYAYLENQLKKEPKNIQVLIQLGVLSWEPFHRQEEAITYLERAIEYDPKNTEARFWLAKCYYHDYCDFEKTRDILLKALEINPERADCLALLADVLLDEPIPVIYPSKKLSVQRSKNLSNNTFFSPIEQLAA